MAPSCILYVDHAPTMGGAERNLVYLLKALDRERFLPILVCPPDSPLAAEAAAASIPVTPLSLPQVKRAPWSAAPAYVAGVWRLAAVARRYNCEIIHANVVRAAAYATPAAKLARCRLVWHVHDIHTPSDVFAWVAGGFADALIAVSEAVLRGIPRRYHAKTNLIYNGFDLAEFDPAAIDGGALRRELGLPDDAVLIGNVGWIAPWKRTRLFLEAAEVVARDDPRVHIVVVGDAADPSYRGLTDDLARFGRERLGERFHWLGARRDMPDVMAALDVLTHTAADEPLGRVLIEAMAMAKPVVAVRSGGPTEIVADGETGLLVADNAAAIAGAMTALLNDESRRREMGRAGRRRADERFDLRRTTAQVESVYSALLDEPTHD